MVNAVLDKPKTRTVSGRVDQNVKRIVDVTLREKGVTASDVISSVWYYIAEMGELPDCATRKPDDKAMRALKNLEALYDAFPKGTELATMDSDGLREELSSRG